MTALEASFEFFVVGVEPLPKVVAAVVVLVVVRSGGGGGGGDGGGGGGSSSSRNSSGSSGSGGGSSRYCSKPSEEHIHSTGYLRHLSNVLPPLVASKSTCRLYKLHFRISEGLGRPGGG